MVVVINDDGNSEGELIFSAVGKEVRRKVMSTTPKSTKTPINSFSMSFIMKYYFRVVYKFIASEIDILTSNN